MNGMLLDVSDYLGQCFCASLSVVDCQLKLSTYFRKALWYLHTHCNKLLSSVIESFFSFLSSSQMLPCPSYVLKNTWLDLCMIYVDFHVLPSVRIASKDNQIMLYMWKNERAIWLKDFTQLTHWKPIGGLSLCQQRTKKISFPDCALGLMLQVVIALLASCFVANVTES